MLAVETRALTKSYGSKNAVNELFMRVEQGTVYGFVGKNGAGKSTTMKMIAGLARQTSGQIMLFGEDKSHQHGVDHAIGALIENPGLLPNLSALDNLMVKSRAMGVEKAKERSKALLDVVGLSYVGSKKVKGFSLGMKQRLGIALALVGNPQLLLLDEPLNGLDPEATRDMRTVIGSLAHEQGITVIISSHVLDQLNRVADTFGVISDGSMVAEFSDAQLQASCGQAVRLRATDPARAFAALRARNAQVPIVTAPDGALVIYSGTNDQEIEAISHILYDAGIILLELGVVKRDIEDYFVELMERGNSHA
ncbi:MAG: ATP-binding cassette domain-containing protein [Coriobacteriales bacterium]|nr:ATP-binding cassette domain-containing protein [Coriobacteriales bacterium]